MPLKLRETNIFNTKYTGPKSSNWWEADQLEIHDVMIKVLNLSLPWRLINSSFSGESGTFKHVFSWFQGYCMKPLSHAASIKNCGLVCRASTCSEDFKPRTGTLLHLIIILAMRCTCLYMYVLSFFLQFTGPHSNSSSPCCFCRASPHPGSHHPGRRQSAQDRSDTTCQCSLLDCTRDSGRDSLVHDQAQGTIIWWCFTDFTN